MGLHGRKADVPPNQNKFRGWWSGSSGSVPPSSRKKGIEGQKKKILEMLF
jgi:hypothetical protein